MNVALIHDHLAQDGGAEKVLKAFSEMFPEATIFTLLYEQKNADKYYKDRKIETSIIQKIPGGVKHYQWYMPFMPMAVEFFDLSSYDLVISDSSSFAKGVITKPETLHICYCHTPTRYLWSDTHQYIHELKYNKYFKKIISLVLNYIRIWDRQAADRVDKYIANSHFIGKRIKKYYRRNSRVIYPPVNVDKFKLSKKQGDYFLAGGRLVPYKRFDIIIKAFNDLAGIGKIPAPGAEQTRNHLKLRIFGDGLDIKRLKKLAQYNKNIEFLGRVTDADLAELYSESKAFIHPQEEDFGITAVEAMASGCPVIAYGRGGVTEAVREGETGVFFSEQTAESLRKALDNFDASRFDQKKIRLAAEKFGVERFKREIGKFIETELETHKQ